jgi:lipoyl(octanoyl) transferase
MNEHGYGYGVINARFDRAPIGALPRPGSPAVEWWAGPAALPYAQALAVMEERAAAVAAGRAPELVWLIEHPPLYTAGTSARDSDILGAGFPVFRSGRGGQFTYHGPGQRVVYLMLDLKRRRPDVRSFVATLEEWIIRTLARFEVHGECRADRIGVWVRRPDKGAGREDKIAAIGIRLKRWVTLHGLSLNVAPDLTHFSGIVPCGIADPRYGVTSLADLGHPATMAEIDAALAAEFERLFGRAEPRDGPPPETAAGTVSQVNPGCGGSA